MGDLEDGVKSGDHKKALIAIRDYLVHELEGHRCKTCQMSQLRTGDTAAIVLRLQKVLDDIAEIPESTGEVTRLESIRRRRDGPDGSSDSKDRSSPPAFGTKAGPRRQGGRRPRSTGGAGA